MLFTPSFYHKNLPLFASGIAVKKIAAELTTATRGTVVLLCLYYSVMSFKLTWGFIRTPTHTVAKKKASYNMAKYLLLAG